MKFNDGKLRPGQRVALGVIQQRVERGEKATAIVLPCRYGKSDVIRLAALKMWDEGIASGSIALSPNTVLRAQPSGACGSRPWQ